MLSRALILGVCAVCCGAADVRLDVPFFRQLDKGCGAASLGMVVGYWGDRIPGLQANSPRELYQRLYSPEEGGIRLSAMKAHLAEQGFHAFTLRGSLTELEQHVGKRRPVIVSVRSGRRLHYTVVTGFSEGRLLIHDPARSKPRRVRRERFEKQWAKADRWMLLAVPRSPQPEGRPEPRP